MKGAMRDLFGILLQLAAWPMPWRIRRSLLRVFLGFELDKEARIGLSLVLARKVRMARGSRVGHGTVVRNVAQLTLGEYGRIGNFNRIAGVLGEQTRSFTDEVDRRPELVICRHASVTNSHLIDCTNYVEVGEFSTVAGWRSQILTHAIDFRSCRQVSEPVWIGRYCFVGTGCVILKGSRLPDKSILAAGSVLATDESENCALYSGVPARKVRSLDEGVTGYFRRATGVVT